MKVKRALFMTKIDQFRDPTREEILNGIQEIRSPTCEIISTIDLHLGKDGKAYFFLIVTIVFPRIEEYPVSVTVMSIRQNGCQ